MVTQLGYDQQSYPAQIQAKIAELQEFVHINLSKAACSQKPQYDQHTTQPAFIVGSPVWLSIPTAGKLDPRWKGDWVIKSMKSSITAEICDRNVPPSKNCLARCSQFLQDSARLQE